MKKPKLAGILSWQSKIALIILPIITLIAAMAAGRMNISPVEIIKSILNHFGGNFEISKQIDNVIWTIRFPRILLALLVGAGLSAAGCAFQSLFSNPLATPDTLGVASGASFGAALGLLMGLNLIGVQMLALACGIAAVLLTWLSGSGKGNGMNTIILAGIMIGSLFTALVSLVKFAADTESQLPAITYWLMGSLNFANFNSLALGAPMIIVGIVVLFLLRWRLNILPLSEDEAKATGTNLRFFARSNNYLCHSNNSLLCIHVRAGWLGRAAHSSYMQDEVRQQSSVAPSCVHQYWRGIYGYC